jgi:GTPase
VARGEYVTRPHRINQRDSRLENALATLVTKIQSQFPNLPNARWVALRLLDGDASVIQAIEAGTLGNLSRGESARPASERLAVQVAS